MTAEICLDGRSLALHEGTGVAGYAAGLAAGVPLIGLSASVLLPGPAASGRASRWLRAAWPGPAHAAPTPAPDGFDRAWCAPDVFRRAQVHVDIHRRLLEVTAPDPPAVMHWTYPLPLAFRGTRNVYTIHDLIPLLHPSLTGIDGARFARILKLVLRRADHVITVSEASRRDIMALGVPGSRVTNTYEAVAVEAPAAAPARHGHFLFCGAIEPRKNVARLLQAHFASGTTRPLVIAGPDGWRATEELRASGVEVRPLEALQPGMGGAYRAPWLPRPALIDLVRGARALLFPSLAEGFGLPIVEAMALGVPVLTSAGGATGEVAGDAALLIDPRDTAAMAAAIAALDRDDDLCERLAAAGLARAGLFSAEACMGRLAPAYDAAPVARRRKA